ncbi:hypothetical protein AVDCRST_MAG84-5670, partial [uncultured Microcoleus sp.]
AGQFQLRRKECRNRINSRERTRKGLCPKDFACPCKVL